MNDIQSLKAEIEALKKTIARERSAREKMEAEARAVKLEAALMDLGVTGGGAGARTAARWLAAEKRVRVTDGAIEFSADGRTFEPLTKEALRSSSDTAWLIEQPRRAHRDASPAPGQPWTGEDLARAIYGKALGTVKPA